MTTHEELEATACRRWNVGCGHFPLSYYTNIDADPDVPADMHVDVPPLPCDDGALDAVWACHFLEHLTPDRAEEFVREAYRALAPGGTLGIVVPDTREVMRRYLAGAIDEVEVPRGYWWRVSDLDHVCAVFLYSTVQPSPHRWAYDAATLARLFVRAGFVELREIDRWKDPRLGSPAFYQVGYEGVKPKES